MALDLSKPVTPPPAKGATQRNTKTSATKKVEASQALTDARAEGLAGIAQLVCIPLALTKNYADVAAVSKHAEPISKEAAKLAATNENIGAILDRICAIGPYAGLIGAIMPFALQILVNHNRLPSGPMLAEMGVEDPNILLQKMQLDAMRQQHAYAEQMAAEQAELAKLMREAENVTTP